jgi:hypothetical protein
VENALEEVLDEVEDQWYVTIVKNWDIMQGNVHFHQQLVCILVHQIMTQKNVRTTSKDLGKEEPEQPKCLVDFSQRKG